MYKTLTLTMIGLVTLVQSGCTPLWERQARAAQSTAVDRPLVSEARQQRAHAIPPSPDTNVPTSVLSIEQLVALGLQRNPTLRARYAAIERLSYTLESAGTLPAPRVQVAPLGDMAQTATGEVTVMAGITQAFPAPGAINAQVIMAEADLQMAEAAMRDFQVRLSQEIRTAYYNWHMAQKSKIIVGEQQKLLQQLRLSILQRIAAGTAKQSDAYRIDVEIDQLQTMISAWDERIETAMAMLRSALSFTASMPLPEVTLIEPTVDYYREADLLVKARALRGDILANRAQHRKAAAMTAAAQARYLPEFGVSFNYNWVADHNVMTRTSGDDQWWVGFSMSVPVWLPAYTAGTHAAAIAREEATLAEHGVSDSLQRDIRTALSAWTSAHEQLHLYSNDMLANAQRAYDTEQALYQGGTSTFLDVIQSWKQVLMIHMSIERLKRDCGVAEAALLSAAGMALSTQLSSLSIEPTSPIK